MSNELLISYSDEINYKIICYDLILVFYQTIFSTMIADECDVGFKFV
jgi:hypothetical protein